MYDGIGDDMKKILGCIVFLLLFTGCTDKVVCTKEVSEFDRKMTTTLNIKFDNDKVKMVNETVVLKFKKDYVDTIDTVYDAINESYEQYKNEKGIDIKTSKDKDSIKVSVEIIPEKQKNSTYNVIDVELNKKESIDDLIKEGYTCK